MIDEQPRAEPRDLDPRAFAIRPVRIIGGQLRKYEAIGFKRPWSGCYMWLNRCRALGYLKEDGHHCLIDILDEEWDIIQDFPVTRRGFEYLRRTLKFRWIRD